MELSAPRSREPCHGQARARPDHVSEDPGPRPLRSVRRDPPTSATDTPAGLTVGSDGDVDLRTTAEDFGDEGEGVAMHDAVQRHAGLPRHRLSSGQNASYCCFHLVGIRPSTMARPKKAVQQGDFGGRPRRKGKESYYRAPSKGSAEWTGLVLRGQVQRVGRVRFGECMRLVTCIAR